ncbi:MAG: S8 family serine peptidase, partial [Gammaproteobacteria bacterium]|nr:S8 family serine peptidase [Gammaproteobacteria bacterium]
MRVYKVCPAGTCPGAAIQGGMNSVLLHGGVSVMNFSISGGQSPWTDNDRRKLDLVNANVLVAASAGNTSDTIPNPVGQVNHRGPWVMSVAASTHDAQAVGLVSASGPGTPPGTTQNLSMSKGSDSPNGIGQVNLPIRHFTGQVTTAEGCTAGEDGAPVDLPAFPAGFFTGSVALIHRGTCPFTKKITNAFNAGAVFVIIRNNQAAAISMSTPGQPNVPAYSIEQVGGNALVAFVDANAATATVNLDIVLGNVLANFSLRGPTAAPLGDLQKPNITGPGVGILAATNAATGYGNMSGTSMSSPHLAGAATLVRKIHPTWTVPEVISALQTTAIRVGRKDTVVSTWDWDDVGSGGV